MAVFFLCYILRKVPFAFISIAILCYNSQKAGDEKMSKKLYRGLVGILFPFILGGVIPYFIQQVRGNALFSHHSSYQPLEVIQILLLFIVFSFLSCRVMIHTMRNICADTAVNLMLGMGILLLFEMGNVYQGNVFSLGGIAFFEYFYLFYFIQKQLDARKK